MAYTYSNNANSTLAANIGPAATTLTVSTGEGALFPSSGTFLCTLCKVSSGIEYAWEIVSATRSGDVFTVTRAQEGTTAGSYLTGDRVSLRVTAGQVAELETASNKDTSGGYPGLTLFKLNLRNAANTVTSWFTTAATAARTWTMPDKDGTVAMLDDITGTNSGTNTGDNAANTTYASDYRAANFVAGTDYVAPGGALGTPSSGTATNLTGLPIATGVSGLASGIATFLATPSSANLAAALTDETGTGANVFATSPAITTPTITGTKETKVAMGANDINLATGNFFAKTISTATTLTVSNVPSTGTTVSFILDLTNGGAGTVTWWSGTKWAGGTAPTLTASGRDVLGFFTHDGGTTWSGFVLGKDVK